jgi:hypothetical protein
MTATFEVFWNTKPEEPSELTFLKALKADLGSADVSATVLATSWLSLKRMYAMSS